MLVDSDLLSAPVGPRQYGLRLETIIRLRWLVVLGQSITLLGVHWGFGFDLPIMPALALAGLTAATNLYLRFRYPRPHRLSEPASGILLGYDVLQLTALLYLTGGVDNPFFAFYLAPLLISATALSPRTTVIIGALIISMVTLLSFVYLPLPWYHDTTVTFPLLYRASEWIAMFDDVLRAQSAVDRFKNAAYDLVIEGESYRSRLKPRLGESGEVTAKDTPAEVKPTRRRRAR